MFGWLFSSGQQVKIEVTYSDDTTAVFWRNHEAGCNHDLMEQGIRAQGRSWKSIQVWY